MLHSCCCIFSLFAQLCVSVGFKSKSIKNSIQNPILKMEKLFFFLLRFGPLGKAASPAGLLLPSSSRSLSARASRSAAPRSRTLPLIYRTHQSVGPTLQGHPRPRAGPESRLCPPPLHATFRTTHKLRMAALFRGWTGHLRRLSQP
jgi:hypothetical protein